MDQGKKKFCLKWPFNLIVYILLAVLLRLFAIPVILLIMAWNRKRQPEGPEGGYCLDRTRKRLGRLLWAALYLLLAASGGVCFYMQLQEDRSLWKPEDWGFTIFSAGLCLVCGVLFFAETYMDVRDAFVPGKSRLAQSIRAQLPCPDEAPDVKELFAMVDRDIRENGRWFGRLAIGREWVFGDDVTAVSRIRGVFPRDEIRVRCTNGRRQSARLIELWIVDDRRQVQCTGLRKPGELTAAVEYLRRLVPGAHFDRYENLSRFTEQPV